VRHPNKERVVVMKQRLRTYTAYSIGCVIAWAIILPAAAVLDSKAILHTALVLCGGWWIGWISATIARAVYPPSARWRQRPARPQAG
jgi:threonine/homoserine/homoserine lactone efflux protein